MNVEQDPNLSPETPKAATDHPRPPRDTSNGANAGASRVGWFPGSCTGSGRRHPIGRTRSTS
jgi:hypothetical protein